MTNIEELISRVRSPFALTERDANEIANALEAQAKEIEELKVLLKDCADDLEAEVDARYGETSKKCMPHRYERDMAPVVAARAALKGEKE